MSNDYGGSNTAPELKDAWSTPQWLFAAVNKRYQFVMDAAAEAHNSKCAAFIGKAENALIADWYDRATQAGGTTVWVNPPYSRGMVAAFMAKAYEESQKGLTVVMLVPATPDAGWWPTTGECEAREITFITHGRINFVSAETGKIVRGNTKGSALITFSPDRGSTTYKSVSREQLRDVAKELGITEDHAVAEVCPIKAALTVAGGSVLDNYEVGEIADRIGHFKQYWNDDYGHPCPGDSQIAKLITALPIEVITHGRRLKHQISHLAKTLHQEQTI